MACTTTSYLIALTAKEYDKLQALFAPLTADQADLASDGASIKDTIGHRAHWIELFLGWYADGMAGKAVSFRRKGTNGTT